MTSRRFEARAAAARAADILLGAGLACPINTPEEWSRGYTIDDGSADRIGLGAAHLMALRSALQFQIDQHAPGGKRLQTAVQEKLKEYMGPEYSDEVWLRSTVPHLSAVPADPSSIYRPP